MQIATSVIWFLGSFASMSSMRHGKQETDARTLPVEFTDLHAVCILLSECMYKIKKLKKKKSPFKFRVNCI